MTVLLIEHVLPADLPPEWARRLETVPGQTVTVRIEADAVVAEAPQAPTTAQGTAPFETDDPAFGIWADRDDMADPTAHVQRLRQGRFAGTPPFGGE